MNKLFEGLEYGDLKGMISEVITIDKYKPKISEEDEVVVVSFSVLYEEPAADLADFIETGALDHLDVEASDIPAENGSYNIFVEFLRDHHLYDKINKMLKIFNNITNKDMQWKYIAFKVDGEQEFNEENFKRDIIDSEVKYRMTYLNENMGYINRLKQLVNY